MNRIARRLATALALTAAVALIAPAASAGSIPIIGCDSGTTRLDQTFDPQRSIGGPGGKIANWHIVLQQKGRYEAPFSSPHPFHMFAYRKNRRTGQWQALGISADARWQGNRWVWRMTATKSDDDADEYLFQAKPNPLGQRYRHVFSAFVRSFGCTPQPPPPSGPPCPPGYYDTGHGTFGQPSCQKIR